MVSILEQNLAVLTHNAFLTLIPRNYFWIAAFLLAALTKPRSLKMGLNLVVSKLIVEVYLLAVKPITSSDPFDWLFPFTTTFERQLLLNYLFAMAFTVFVQTYVFRGGEAGQDTQVTERMKQLKREAEYQTASEIVRGVVG